MNPKPIETYYKGYRFRSRLEARWAVFFDALGIEWEYEKEGYDLDGVWYLPDFWLPQVQMWAEVKPVEFSHDERMKIAGLVTKTGFSCLKLIGVPDFTIYYAMSVSEGGSLDDVADYRISNDYLHENRFYGNCGWIDLEEEFLKSDSFYVEAVHAARAARFGT